MDVFVLMVCFAIALPVFAVVAFLEVSGWFKRVAHG
jgi:hypothetical protein